MSKRRDLWVWNGSKTYHSDDMRYQITYRNKAKRLCAIFKTNNEVSMFDETFAPRVARVLNEITIKGWILIDLGVYKYGEKSDELVCKNSSEHGAPR